MNDTSDLVLFLGRFHPLLVHLPIGFLVLLVTLESLARMPRFRGANACASYVLALLVPAAVLAATCGWLLAQSGDYNRDLLRAHRWLGVATVLLCALAALLHSRRWSRTYAVTLYASVIVLAVASHLGGSLTHGSDYLTRYTPAPLKSLFGWRGTRTEPAATAAGRQLFPTVIQPLLQTRCGACHNPEKRKGGLRVDTLEALRQGGKNGPVIVAGNAAQSPLVQRLLLPLEDDDHMPPDGKPQPEPGEIALLRWWIDTGASSNAVLDELRPPAEVRDAIERLKHKAK